MHCTANIHYAENQRDSASEPDEEDTGDPWLKLFDSHRRQYFWQNFATNAITYDEPEDELAHEKDMIGKRVKIYWVVQVCNCQLLFLVIAPHLVRSYQFDVFW